MTDFLEGMAAGVFLTLVGGGAFIRFAARRLITKRMSKELNTMADELAENLKNKLP